MAIVTGDRYLESLVRFVGKHAGPLLDGSLVLKLNPAGLHYVQSRIEALGELESLLASAPVDYLRAYVSDLGDHRDLEQLRRILRLLTSLKVVSVLPPPSRDPTPLSLLPFGRLRVLELRGCDLSTSAARGLLALRPTLEKIICHNSTDALRHVFADRIAEIRKCPPWSRLTTVSCPCNALIFMDESLHLLPAAETLDLSRNRFAKVDNLLGCKKLRYLDLGFNHLRTISSLIEVSCPIVKLILRNNALTSLRGIENLKMLEGLDLSHNIISKFSEIELLGGLSCLRTLLLEGNPICYARWYRAQVWSYFINPERLKLDERGMDNKDFWKMKIIRLGRQEKPAGYGCYAPAVETEQNGNSNVQRKKLSRIAHIEDSEQMQVSCAETVGQESFNTEDHKNYEIGESEGESNLLRSTSRGEFIKKEKSVLWLKDVRDSSDQAREELVEHEEDSKLISRTEKHMKTGNKNKNKRQRNRCSDLSSIVVSADEDSDRAINSDVLLSNTPIEHINDQCFVSCSEVGSANIKQDSINLEGSSMHFNDSITASKDEGNGWQESLLSWIDIDERTEARNTFANPGSPPYYKEDILHQRHNLEDEFMQLSTGSKCVVSSDSDANTTSTSDYSCCADGGSSGVDDGETLKESMVEHPSGELLYKTHQGWHGDLHSRKNTRLQVSSYSEPISSIVKALRNGEAKPSCTDDLLADAGGGNHNVSQDMEYLENVRSKREPKRRIVSLQKMMLQRGNNELLMQKSNGVLDVAGIDMENKRTLGNISGENNHFHSHGDIDEKNASMGQPGHLPMFESINSISRTSTDDYSTLISDEFMRNYFNFKITGHQASEICQDYVVFSCIQFSHQGPVESEVSVVLSSENKLYILHISTADHVTGVNLEVGACHRAEDIKDIVVGIGLLVVRVQITGDITYLFVTKTVEKSRALLGLLLNCESNSTADRYPLRSWEQKQMHLFDSDICRGLEMSINLYSMLLFWYENGKGESWILRSIVLVGGYILICMEDLRRFGLFNDDPGEPKPYFSLDSCCSVCDISEMVIEPGGSGCVTLILDHVTPGERCFSGEIQKRELVKERGSLHTWRFKWFSEETLLKFVAVVKAMYAGVTLSPLTVKYAT